LSTAYAQSTSDQKKSWSHCRRGLEKDICSLAEPESQVDPKFQSPFKYTRMTAKAMRQALIEKKGWKEEDLPCENTIGNILKATQKK
jgi:hypothetical protein